MKFASNIIYIHQLIYLYTLNKVLRRSFIANAIAVLGMTLKYVAPSPR